MTDRELTFLLLFSGAMALAGILLYRLTALAKSEKLKEMSYRELINSTSREKEVTASVLELVEVMRDNRKSPREFAAGFLSLLCQKTGAASGSLLIYDEHSHNLTTIATFAAGLNAPKKSFAPGESLAGEVFLDGRMRLVDKVPEGYLSINSATGFSDPAQLLFIPVKNGARTIGVMELASLVPFTESHHQVISRIIDSFGPSLLSLLSMEENIRLLNESEEKSRTLAIKENELEKKISELSLAHAQLQETRVISERRISEHINSQKNLMEKTVKRYEDQIAALQLELRRAGSNENNS